MGKVAQQKRNNIDEVKLTRCKAKADCSPPGYPPSRLLGRIIVNWSVIWFAYVHRFG